jgi:hypothetical protein
VRENVFPSADRLNPKCSSRFPQPFTPSSPSLSSLSVPDCGFCPCPFRLRFTTHARTRSSATMADSNDSRPSTPARSSKPVSEALLNEKVPEFAISMLQY